MNNSTDRAMFNLMRGNHSNVKSEVRTYQGKSYKANIVYGNDYVLATAYFWGTAYEDEVTMSKTKWSNLPLAEIESVDS